MSDCHSFRKEYTARIHIAVALLVLSYSATSLATLRNKSLVQIEQFDTEGDSTIDECGPCLTEWNTIIEDLRELSIDSIKKAHGLVESLLSNSTIYQGENESSPHRLSESGGSDTIAGLKDKINFIGEQILVKKQNKDRLDLLRGELEGVIKKTGSTRAELMKQTASHIELTKNIASFSMRLEDQTNHIRKLSEAALVKYYSKVAITRLESLMNLKKAVFSQLQRSRKFLYEALEGRGSDSATMMHRGALFQSLQGTGDSIKFDIDSQDSGKCRNAADSYNLYRGLVNFAQHLHASISETKGLEEQFKRNRRRFLEQEKLILMLRNEVETIMDGALQKINFLRTCR